MFKSSKDSISIQAFIAWFAASLFACFQFCSQIILGPMTADLMGRFSLDAVSVSYVVSSFFYIYLLMQLPAGMILDRYPTKYVMPVTCLICATGAILMGLATNTYFFVIARMICGFGSAFGFIGTMRVLRNYFTIRHMTLFIGFTEMMGFLLTAVCAHVVSYFLPIFGFQTVLFYFGCIGLFVVALMCVTNLKKMAPKHAYAPPVRHDISLVLRDFRSLVTNKQLLILGLISFSFFSVVTAFAALWGVPALMSLHNLSLQESTQAISCIFFGISTGGPLIGYLHLKIKRYELLIFWSGIASVILILALIFSSELSLFTLCGILYLNGILSCCYLLCFTIANDLVPAKLSGTCMGLINLITMTSALVIQPVMGYLVALSDVIGVVNGAPVYPVSGYKRVCLVLVALFLLASIMSFKVKKSD